MNFPKDYYFTKEHEWVHIEDVHAYVGLTEFAKKELEEIKSVQIHKLGESLNVGQVFGRVTTKRYLCKLIMPLSGTIVEVNEDYCNNAKQFNTYFGKEHWIIKIAIKPPLDISKLLDDTEYRTYNTNNLLHMVKYLLSL